MKKIISLFVLAAIFLLTACDNDDFATGGEPPIFDEFTLSKYKVAPEEEITGSVTYKYEGRYVYKMKYRVNKIKDGKSEQLAEGVLVGEQLNPLIFSFKAPKEIGSYRIYFYVYDIEVSILGANGSPFVTPPSGVYAKSVLTVE